VFVVAALAPSEMMCPAEMLRRNQLARRIPGVSRKVLTTTLRHMEEAGLVHKEILAEVPSHVVGHGQCPAYILSLAYHCRHSLLPSNEINEACERFASFAECALCDRYGSQFG
jgi:hypothetical protein